MFSLEVIPAGSLLVLWEGAQAPAWLLVGGFSSSGAACFSGSREGEEPGAACQQSQRVQDPPGLLHVRTESSAKDSPEGDAGRDCSGTEEPLPWI